ncbi:MULTISPECIES: hypothetical protein [Ectothiorhodospira]|nr:MULTISPECIES: hypothetical protein [Ectothiorhodospira]MCG5494094.1 hypothetical protein [Ectothiorhodospira variabilis]MCG5503376.1 hypothetical protein [Ectothiorhodospira variabilis]MCG5506536.1 hypothetical protein [Ectothiorhodospira variabilis]MCG5524255.1 hypothetical protein [Ectothiorhodospira haloalkaliphila]
MNTPMILTAGGASVLCIGIGLISAKLHADLESHERGEIPLSDEERKQSPLWSVRRFPEDRLERLVYRMPGVEVAMLALAFFLWWAAHGPIAAFIASFAVIVIRPTLANALGLRHSGQGEL